MYMLNLLFDSRSLSGIFDTPLKPMPASPLDAPRTWLSLKDATTNAEVPALPPGVTPTTVGGANLKWDAIRDADGPLFLTSAAGTNAHEVWIRFALDPNLAAPPPIPPITANSQLLYVATFGAPSTSDAVFASPFDLNSANDAQTIFTSQNQVPFPATAADGWFFKLGVISSTKVPKKPHRLHRHEFSVAAWLVLDATRPTNPMNFGIDPEMDIGG